MTRSEVELFGEEHLRQALESAGKESSLGHQLHHEQILLRYEAADLELRAAHQAWHRAASASAFRPIHRDECLLHTTAIDEALKALWMLYNVHLRNVLAMLARVEANEPNRARKGDGDAKGD